MKCTKIALATLFAGMMVTFASADISRHTENFNSYTKGDKILDANPSSWESGLQDESVVTNAYTAYGETTTLDEGDLLLQINTEGDVLTNKLDTPVSISFETNLFMDADILFVPSDELTTPDADATLKLALYAFQPEGAENAKLVVYHSYLTEEGDFIASSTPTDVTVSSNSLEHVRVTLKKFEAGENKEYGNGIPEPYAFQVQIGETIVTSTNAYTAEALEEAYNGTYYTGAAGDDPGSWFLTANLNPELGTGSDKSQVEKLAFQGTGYVDNILVSEEEPYVPNYVAQIVGGNSYETLAGALAAATSGDTVKFLTNIVVDATVSITNNLTLDLNGYSLSNTTIRVDETVARTLTASSGSVVVTNGTIYGRVNCYDDSTLTIAADTTVEGYVVVWGDGTYGESGCKTPTLNVAGTINAEGEGATAIFNGASDTSKPNINILDGAVVNADWGVILNGAAFTMSGGTINANSRGVEATKGSTVAISGGTINAATDGSGIGLWDASTLTMTGGDITAGSFGVFNNGLEASGTTMTISGGSITSTNGAACGIYQAGLGTLTLSGTAVVTGPDAVEVRAGTVEVQNYARLVATATYTAPTSNGGGSSGHGGVALLVSQHTTAQSLSATVSGGTLTGAVAFAEVTLESQNDASLVSGAISGGVLYGSVDSEDIVGLIPGNSTAKFSDANAEGLAPGYELVEDSQNPGLYVVQPIQTYEIAVTVTNGTIGTNGNEIASGTTIRAVAGTEILFSANQDCTLSSVTNNGVAVSGIDTTTNAYTYVVGNADATVSVVFAASAGSDDFVAEDVVDGAALGEAKANWLNGLKDAKNMTKAQFTAALDSDGITLADEYLLNTDPTVATTVSFTISSIAVGENVDVQVTLTRSENSSAIESAINGVLKIKGAATVNGTYTDDQTLTDKFSGGAAATKSFSTENKFFKAVITDPDKE